MYIIQMDKFDYTAHPTNPARDTWTYDVEHVHIEILTFLRKEMNALFIDLTVYTPSIPHGTSLNWETPTCNDLNDIWLDVAERLLQYDLICQTRQSLDQIPLPEEPLCAP